MSGNVRGTQTSVTLFEEDVFGADPSSPDGQKLYYESFSVKQTRALDEDPTITGDRSKVRPAQGVIDVSGSIVQKLSAQSSGTLFKHALGVNNTTGTDPYVHTMTIGALPLSMTLERNNGTVISGSGKYEKLNGGRIGSVEFDFPKDDYPTVTYEIIGASSTYASTPLDASITDNGHTAFHSSQLTIIEEGGAGIAYIESAKFTIDSDLETDTYVLGGEGVRRDICEGDATITGEAVVLLESMDLLNKARNNTASNLKFIYSRGDGLGSAGNESIEFLLQNLDFEDNGSEIEGPAGVKVTLPFVGYKVGSDLGLQIILKNAVPAI